ncbi:MAG: hypothetical protein JNK75_14095 [Betaproteobacteria bacterium]|nr:hypothetical protein [Betaproteobacteria bacterium]
MLAMALALLPLQAYPNDAALQKCRGLEDPFARLKCYDAIPLAGTPAATATPARPAASPSAAAPVAVPTPPAAAQAPAPAATFGLPPRAPDEALDRIESRIAGRFEGWRANSNIRLANGQVWQVADDSARFLDLENPKVVIRRGALGSFYLEVEGTNHSPRVRRVR